MWMWNVKYECEWVDEWVEPCSMMKFFCNDNRTERVLQIRRCTSEWDLEGQAIKCRMGSLKKRTKKSNYQKAFLKKSSLKRVQYWYVRAELTTYIMKQFFLCLQIFTCAWRFNETWLICNGDTIDVQKNWAHRTLGGWVLVLLEDEDRWRQIVVGPLQLRDGIGLVQMTVFHNKAFCMTGESKHTSVFQLRDGIGLVQMLRWI